MPGTSGPSLESVAAFYDNVAAMEILFGESIHVGCWPEGEGELPLADAQRQLASRVAAAASAREGMRLLDVGCGTGGPARWLARTLGVSVRGVAISPNQVAAATARSLREGLGGRAVFQVTDAAALPFADGEFDAAIAIESIFHMPDKPGALREVCRVLRGGAALIIAEFAEREPGALVADSDAAASLLGLMDIPSGEDYRQLLTAAGFDVKDIADISDQVMPTFPRLDQRMTDQHAALTATAGAGHVTALREVIALFGAALAAGKASYIIITARKTATV
jgi:ubiquinone/menaquinone biosynthesis C-methylase UbiE